MKIDLSVTPASLSTALENFWQLAGEKANNLESSYDRTQGSPVFTVNGKYTTRGWTEWTQGFQYGIPLLVFSATGNQQMLELGKKSTLERMAHHVTHFGVHDHGFNNLSTYGQLLRLANTGLFQASDEEKQLYALAVSASGAVQARRWTEVKDGGYLYSFNGPHSLFIDTMRTCRILLAAHLLGHRMLTDHDEEINLLERAVIHGLTTARYAVYYGEGRDGFDIRGRTAHESIFNTNDGHYRCPNAQQGFSGYTTWTRGLAWAMLGFSEFLEFLLEVDPDVPGLESVKKTFLKTATATCDFYLDHCSLDGIPYWDTGAPQIHKLGDYQARNSEPYNAFEPVDSSAAAIGAQGLIRLGKCLADSDPELSNTYTLAGLTILRTLLSEPFISSDPGHQGLLLHSVYHHPNGWDFIPEGKKVPCGESSMWGDYHMAELCYTVDRMARGEHYTFFEGL